MINKNTLNELGPHEYNIIYLSWLIDKGHVSFNLGEIYYDKEEVDIHEDDYEISFEAEHGVGYNYELLDCFYNFDKIGQILRT